MLDIHFHSTARRYVESLIRQRHYLIKAGKSHLNIGFINQCLATLEKYLQAYTFKSDLKMAVFWSAHREEIYALIPGKDSGSHKVCMQAYLELNRQADHIVSNDLRYIKNLFSFSSN